MTGEDPRPRPASDPEAPVGSFDDTLSALGNSTRLQILRELSDAASTRGMGATLSFSDLYDRVDVDDSGQFNYHLNKLTDRFVTKLDGEYAARLPGLAIVATMYAGTYRDPSESTEAVAETEFTCPGCGTPATAHYGRKTLFSGTWLECEDHGPFDLHPVPPGARHGRSLRDVLNASYMRAYTNVHLARQGICLECWGQMSVTYPVDREIEDPPAEEFIWTELSCRRCWNRLAPPLRSVLLTHPSMAALFRNHGYERQEAAEAVTNPHSPVRCETELHGTDPVTATLQLEVGTDRLTLTVDENCAVTDTRSGHAEDDVS